MTSMDADDDQLFVVQGISSHGIGMVLPDFSSLTFKLVNMSLFAVPYLLMISNSIYLLKYPVRFVLCFGSLWFPAR